MQRQAERRKQKETALRRQRHFERQIQTGARDLLRAGGRWPLLEVLISPDWEDTGALTEILVARRSPAGQVVVGVFLVDHGCLGIKSAFGRAFRSTGEYQRDLRESLVRGRDMLIGDLNLAARIMDEALAYARELGFAPDPDYYAARLVLGDAQPQDCPLRVPLGGTDGKPLFVSGPNDDVEAIMATLTRKLGRQGFHYLIAVPGTTPVYLEESPDSEGAALSGDEERD